MGFMDRKLKSEEQEVNRRVINALSRVAPLWTCGPGEATCDENSKWVHQSIEVKTQAGELASFHRCRNRWMSATGTNQNLLLGNVDLFGGDRGHAKFIVAAAVKHLGFREPDALLLADGRKSEDDIDEISGWLDNRLGNDVGMRFTRSWDLAPEEDPGVVVDVNHKLYGSLSTVDPANFWWADVWCFRDDMWGMVRQRIDSDNYWWTDPDDETPGSQRTFWVTEAVDLDKARYHVLAITALFLTDIFYPHGRDSPRLVDQIGAVGATDAMPFSPLAMPRLSDNIRNLWRVYQSIENRDDDVGQYGRNQLSQVFGSMPHQDFLHFREFVPRDPWT